MDDFEKKWKRIQEQLRIQMSGDEQPRVSSGRTLFGIRSEGERKMEEFARQIEAEYQVRELEKRKTNANHSAGFGWCYVELQHLPHWRFCPWRRGFL